MCECLDFLAISMGSKRDEQCTNAWIGWEMRETRDA